MRVQAVPTWLRVKLYPVMACTALESHASSLMDQVFGVTNSGR